MNFIFDVETTGLNPMEDRVLCVSLLNPESNTPVSFYGKDEKQVLMQFWGAIRNAEVFITFNGDGFDIPFLIKRSLINNVKITKKFKNHIDLRKVVNGFSFSYNKYEKGKLTDWAKVLGIPAETENGSTMNEYYEKKDWKTIKAHCEEDTIISKKLLERCKECDLIE